MAWKVIVSLSFISMILGAIGMIIFATRFHFSTRIKDLQLAEERIFGLDGYQVWMISWILIIFGTFVQLIHFWITYRPPQKYIIKFGVDNYNNFINRGA